MFGNTPTIDVSQWFSVNSTTGVVYVSGHLDRENASQVVLTISGMDMASNDAATSTTEPDGMFKQFLNFTDGRSHLVFLVFKMSQTEARRDNWSGPSMCNENHT